MRNTLSSAGRVQVLLSRATPRLENPKRLSQMFESRPPLSGSRRRRGGRWPTCSGAMHHPRRRPPIRRLRGEPWRHCFPLRTRKSPTPRRGMPRLAPRMPWRRSRTLQRRVRRRRRQRRRRMRLRSSRRRVAARPRAPAHCPASGGCGTAATRRGATRRSQRRRRRRCQTTMEAPRSCRHGSSQ